MLAILLSVMTIHFVALISPGPDFFYVTQVATKSRASESLRAVLGITVGVMIWSGIALLGLHILLERWHWLQTGLVLLGASYLFYLAFLLLRSAYRQRKKEAREDPNHLAENRSNSTQSTEEVTTMEMHSASIRYPFLKGLFTNLANPKAIAYFGSIFSMLITDSMSFQFKGLIFILISLETFLWFMFVSRIFSLPALQRRYQKVTHWIDAVTGLLFGGFATYFLFQELKRYWIER